MNVYYKEINNEIKIFTAAFKKKLPVMIKGPTGCGKSRFVESMAQKINIPLIQIACNEETSAVDLQGRYLIENGNTIWYDGPATTAVKNGCMLYLDEISEAREDVIVVIHPLADHRREIYIDKKNHTIKAPDNFMLVASYNPGYQSKIKDLKPSTKQRFVTLQFDYPNEKEELEIILNETHLKKDIAIQLTAYAKKLRNLKDLDLIETVSTRLIINAGKLIEDGLDIKTACKISIIQTLTDDKDIQINLEDILELYI